MSEVRDLPPGRFELARSLTDVDRQMARAYQNRDMQTFYYLRDWANKLRRRLRDMDREETENA